MPDFDRALTLAFIAFMDFIAVLGSIAWDGWQRNVSQAKNSECLESQLHYVHAN